MQRIPTAAPDERRPRRMSKGMYILPSLFTTGNMAAGFYAILEVVHATALNIWHLDNAAKAIGFAVLFDGLDGRVARMTGTSSDFGKELDSLADVITFGVAPAMLAWTWGFHLMQPGVALTDWNIKLTQVGAIASFFIPDGWGQPFGAVQHHDESSAFQSRTSRKEILCGHADSRWGRSDRCGGSLSGGVAHHVLVYRDHLAGDGRGRRLPDGEHLAFLQFQGALISTHVTLSPDYSGRALFARHLIFLEAGVFGDGVALHVFRRVLAAAVDFPPPKQPPPPAYKEASSTS